MAKKIEPHSLMAFTKDLDFIPTLYVIGQIRSNGEFVGVKLDEVQWSEKPEDTLVLRFTPDNFDPQGPSHIQISPFHKILKSQDQYKIVLIESKQGNIQLEVQKIPPEGHPVSRGGGSEAPRG